MVERLRALLDRPLDPSAARAVIILAIAILLGLAALFVLRASEPSPPMAAGRQAATRPQTERSLRARRVDVVSPSPRRLRRRRQDPQDEKGSPAAARAAKALRSHRALQHVPYRHGSLRIRLVGARGGRAVLAVSARTSAAARRGWRRFLRRYGDSGRSYVPRFLGRRDGGTHG